MQESNKLSLAPIFCSGMVIQREKPVTIWGNAPEYSVITVELCGCRKSTVTDGGEWKCVLPPQRAGEGYELSVSCNLPDVRNIYLKDISIGDIWLACGQSNMEFFLRYDADYEAIKKYEKNNKIHMYNVPQLAFEGQSRSKDGYGIWFRERECGFETFSAPGYSFARYIQPITDVPIGIIGCNWGGSTASSWLDESCLADSPLSIYLEEYEAALKLYSPDTLKRMSMEGWAFEDSPEHIKDFMPLMYGQSREWQEKYMKSHEKDPFIPMGPYHFNRPGGLYHQMLEPLISFSVKGILWYQGESDAIHAEIYDKLFTALIICWRRAFNDDKLPFLFVQLAPFGKWLDCDACGYPEIRRRQEIVSKNVPHTAMASIMDIGCYYDIHPKQKMEVGRRLALLALGKVYGKHILSESPELERAEIKEKKIILTFKNCKDNCGKHQLFAVKKETDNSHSVSGINGFKLQQNQTEIPLKEIRLEENNIILHTAIPIEKHCTIYFACSNYVEVNIFNAAGLPLKPFICEI